MASSVETRARAREVKSLAEKASLRRMRRALTVIGIAGVLTAGSGSAAIGSFHRYSIPGYGTSLALPSSWKTINYRQVLTPGALQELARENPELAGSLAAMAQ